MFFNLIQKQHIFQKPENTKLIFAIPLCARTIIFFCDNLMFYHYSLLDQKILYHSKLPGRPIQAIPYSGHQILCTILETRSLMLLDIRKKSLEDVTKLPLTKIHLQNRQRDLFTQTRLINFEKSGSFLVYEPREEEQKINVYFYEKDEKGEESAMLVESFIPKEYSRNKRILKKFDNEHKLVFFDQEIADNGFYKFAIISCKNNFAEKEISLTNQAFTRFSIIREIVKIGLEPDNQKFLIFVNTNGPSILLVSHQEISTYPYQANKILLNSILVNIDCGYGIFSFIPDTDEADPECTHVLELIQLKNGKVHERKKCKKNHEVAKSWQDDYLLTYRREIHPSFQSVFYSEHIIDKKTVYMKMLWEKGFEEMSSGFMEEILKHF